MDHSGISNTYPDPLKLKGKYSPVKKIPPLKDRESLSRYEQFALSPQRNDFRRSRSTSPTLRVQHISKSNISPISNSSDSSDALKISNKVQNGTFSPIRRSGSPVRRQHINSIEQDKSRKRQANEELNSPTKKSKNVTFNETVRYNDFSVNPGLKDFSSQEVMETIKDKQDLNLKLDKYIESINKRLDRIESVQFQILEGLNKNANPKMERNVDILQETINDTKKQFE